MSDRDPDHIISEAAEWLRSQPSAPRLVVPALRAQFGLTPMQACLAIAEARRLPIRRASDAA